MAMGGDSGGEGEPIVEINVTPMTDVLLCMLILFMVAQPKSPNENIPINVPQESPTQLPSDPNATLLVKVFEDGSAQLGTQKLSSDFDEMVEQFKANEKAQTDGKVAVKAEGKIKYGHVVRVMAAAHEAGIADVGIASDKF
jgi:biopolymer transport protein ExbD